MSVANGAYTRTNSFVPERDSVVPRFFIESVQDQIASQRENRPVFFDQERVELLMPGNPYTAPVQIVTDEHRERWPEAYARFKAGQEMSANGTPLEQWPILKRSQVLELKALNIMTVEHVAAMPDTACQRFMGGMRLRELAKAYLDDAAAGAMLSQATAENERLRSAVAELQHKHEEQTEMINRLFSELQALKSAPNAIQSFVPASADPIAQMQLGGSPPSGSLSSLESLPDLPRRRGRPPKVREEVA